MAVLPETPASAAGGKGKSTMANNKLAQSLLNLSLLEPSPVSTHAGTAPDHSSPSTPEENGSGAAADNHPAAATSGSSRDSVVGCKDLDDPFLDRAPGSSRAKDGAMKGAADAARTSGSRSAGADVADRIPPGTPHGLTIKSEPSTDSRRAWQHSVLRLPENPIAVPEPISADNAQSVLPPKACVFVANLSSAETDLELTRAVHELFDRFGRVWIKIRRDGSGMPFAFCQYETEESARRAIVEGRSQMVNGRPCRTEPAKVNRSVYISKVTGEPVTEAEVRDALRTYGAIESLWSPTERAMYQLPEGIWIKFGYFQDCRDLQNAFRGHALYRVEQPSAIEPHRSVAKVSGIQSRLQFPGFKPATERRSVFVGNLPANINRDRLFREFGQYGRICDVDIVFRRVVQGTGNRCFAFVQFLSLTQALNAMRGHNGRILDGRVIRVEIKETNDGPSSTPLPAPIPCNAPPAPADLQEEMKRNTALLEQQRQILALQSWQISQATGGHGTGAAAYGVSHPSSPAPSMAPSGAPNVHQGQPWSGFAVSPAGHPGSGNVSSNPTPTQGGYPTGTQPPPTANHPSPAPQTPAPNTQNAGMAPPYHPFQPMGQFQLPPGFYPGAPYHFPMH